MFIFHGLITIVAIILTAVIITYILNDNLPTAWSYGVSLCYLFTVDAILGGEFLLASMWLLGAIYCAECSKG
jgi:hypothetical protein